MAGSLLGLKLGVEFSKYQSLSFLGKNFNKIS